MVKRIPKRSHRLPSCVLYRADLEAILNAMSGSESEVESTVWISDEENQYAPRDG